MKFNRVKRFRKIVPSLALSIAALLVSVNAEAQPLSSVNRSKSADKSAKSSKDELDRLIQTLLRLGDAKTISDTMAPIIGLKKSSKVRQQDVIVRQDKRSGDMRTCFVVISNDDDKSPMCLFVKRSRQTMSDSESKYFRVNLSGELEDALTWTGKKGATGGIRGSGAKTQQDIASPVVKKEFEAEMAFWLKDWLKREQKAHAKKPEPSKT